MSLTDTKYKRKSLAITVILLSALLFLMFYAGYSYIYPPERENLILIEITEEHIEEMSASLSSSEEPVEETAPGEHILTGDEEVVIVPKGPESKGPVEQPREPVRPVESLSKETAMAEGAQKIATAFKTTTIQSDQISKVYKVGNSDTTTIGIITFYCKCINNGHICKDQKIIQGTEAYYNKLIRDAGSNVRSYKAY